MNIRYFDPVNEEGARKSRRNTFSNVAELYQQARPTYPKALLDELVIASKLHDGGRVLEIGCGTGQATRPLAERGYEVVGVELSSEMATVAKRELGAFSNARVHSCAFEDWPLPVQPFDLVLAAESFHWIDPAIRLKKAAQALKPAGYLATIGAMHVAGGSREFFKQVQAVYDEAAPSIAHDSNPSNPIKTLPHEGALKPGIQGLEESGLFHEVLKRVYPLDIAYNSRDYISLLNTYSDHIRLPAKERKSLFAAIAELIDDNFGGRITKRYAFELVVAQKL